MQIHKEMLIDRMSEIINELFESGHIVAAGTLIIMRDEIESGTFDIKEDTDHAED